MWKSSYSLYNWKWHIINLNHELGLKEDEIKVPTEIPFECNDCVISVACSNRFSLILTGNSEVYGSGSNDYNQFGVSQSILSTFTKLPFQNIGSISCGGGHIIALNHYGEVLGSGNNEQGQIASGELVQPNIYKINGLPPIKSVSCGISSTYCIDENGYLWSFGANRYLQLGVKTEDTYSSVPLQVTRVNNISAISSGGWHCFIKDTDDIIYVCGNNSHHQLGFSAYSPDIDLTIFANPYCEDIFGSHKYSKYKSARN